MRGVKVLILLVAIVSLGCVGPGIKLGPYMLTPMANAETIGLEVTESDSGDLVGSLGVSLQTLIDHGSELVDKVLGGGE